MDNETKECIEHIQKDMVHQFHIMVEHVIDKVQIVAEGVASLSERVDKQRDEFNQKIVETQTMMGTLHRHLDRKIDETANRLDKKVNRLDEKVGQLDAKVERLDEKVNQLGGKVERLDGKVERLDGKVERLDGKVERLDAKVERLGKKIDTEVKGLRVDIIRVESKVELAAERLEHHEKVIQHL